MLFELVMGETTKLDLAIKAYCLSRECFLEGNDIDDFSNDLLQLLGLDDGPTRNHPKQSVFPGTLGSLFVMDWYIVHK